MSVLPIAFLTQNDFPYVYPVGVIVGDVAGQNLGIVVWNFDTSGGIFQLNSSFQIKPKNFYTIYYEFSVEGTIALPGLPHTLQVLFQDTLGNITIPPYLTLPINQYTSGSSAVFQTVYSGYLSLDSDYVPAPNEVNGFQFQATLVPNPAQVGDTGLSMTLQKMTIQQTPYDNIIPYSYAVANP